MTVIGEIIVEVSFSINWVPFRLFLYFLTPFFSVVEQNCKEEDNGKGPVTVRTPNGLGESEWRRGLKLYAERNGQT